MRPGLEATHRFFGLLEGGAHELHLVRTRRDLAVLCGSAQRRKRAERASRDDGPCGEGDLARPTTGPAVRLLAQLVEERDVADGVRDRRGEDRRRDDLLRRERVTL